MSTTRENMRKIVRRYLDNDDPLGWFEAVYTSAEYDPGAIAWVDMEPNPNLLEWLDRENPSRDGKTALIIGCGLGDDAEELVRRGFQVTAFDISDTAIQWCRKRFPESSVDYIVADLFEAPESWNSHFDFVLEAYTLQVLPPELRNRAIKQSANFVAPGGTLLLICRGREPNEPEGKMPWPLTKDEANQFLEYGLTEHRFEAYLDKESPPPVKRFRGEYLKK